MVGRARKAYEWFRAGIDWKWRVVSIGCAALFIILISVISLQIVFAGVVRTKTQADDARMLSSWLSDLNRAALSKGRPELSVIKPVADRNGVREVMIFDANGRVVAPLALHGRKFFNKTLFDKVLSSRKRFERLRKDGAHEILSPVSSTTDNPFSGAVGAVHLVVKKKGPNVIPYLVISICIVALCLSALIWWVVRETLITIDSGGRFDLLKRRRDEICHDARASESRVFEVAWRNLVHLISAPALILDAQCRLKEMNEEAEKRFGGGREGMHLIDLLADDELSRPITELLGELKTCEKSMVRKALGRSSVSIFTAKNGSLSFKYTIVCSEVPA